MDAQTSAEKPAVKISIVVPVYNDAEYLPTCLDSLVNQTLKEIEILLVNDGSTDASLAIMNEYAARDSRIRVFSFPENRSAFTARNEGIRHASGEYIMFADGDDYLELNACERVWELEQESPVDILNFNSNIIVVAEKNANHVGYIQKVPNDSLQGPAVFRALHNSEFTVLLWNKCFQRELCLRVVHECGDLFLPKGNDDLFMSVAAFFARSFRGCPSVSLYNHRYGFGIEGSKKKLDLPMFELFLKAAWVLNEGEKFIRENTDGEYEEALRRKRRNIIYRCVAFWGDMASQDQPEALRLLLRYWSKPGDLGKIAGAFSRVFGNRQGDLADLLISAMRRLRLRKQPIRTVGTYYRRYANGGIERVLSLTLPIWIRLGYQVVFLTDEENENDYSLPKGVIRVNCAVSCIDGAKDYTERGEDWENLLRMYEIDVMVYHNCYANSHLWDKLLCRLMGIPVLTFYHGSIFSLLQSASVAALIPGAARLGDGAITLNEMDRTFWRCAAPETKVFQVKHPLTFEPTDVEPSDLDGPLAIVWTGRLSVEKRYLDPVEIMAEVVKRVPDAKLYLVGAGEGNQPLNALNSRITELGLEKSVIPCGFQMDMATWYRKASVFLLTSSGESFSFSLAEALTFGLPVVMYELPYLTLVQGNGGIVSVPQQDIKAAADAICELLENREHRREVGWCGREFIENLYAEDEIAEQWRRIFDSIGEQDATPQEPEAYREIVQFFLKKYKTQLPAPSGTSDPASSSLLRFLYGDETKQRYAYLRTSGPPEKREVSLVSPQQDGKNLFNVLLKSDGTRNWITSEELKKAVQDCYDNVPLRFLYGDEAKQQYVELCSGGPQDKLEVSFVTQQDRKRHFNTLLKSDGTRNWVAPEELNELKTLMEHSGASETALEAQLTELTEQFKELQACRDTQAEVRKALTGQTGGEWPCIRFTYGDEAKQQYAELRASGPLSNREVSFVSHQEDGQMHFNTLFNSDGNRNWVTPEELKRFTERSSASEKALEAKVADLAEQLERLQALYTGLSEEHNISRKRKKV